MNNLHISLTSFKNESRLLKQANSLLVNTKISTVFVAALHEEDLKENESIKNNLLAHRFKLTTRRWGANIFVRLLKYIEFCLRVSLYYRKKDVEVINVHSLALLPLGVILKYVYKAKLIYDTHELETESNGLTGGRQRLARIVESKLIYKADGVIVVCDSIGDWYEDKYKITRPTVVMNAPIYKEIGNHDKFRALLNIKKEHSIFLYQGLLSPGRGIELILEAFKKVEPNNIIIFMGYGVLQNLIEEYSKESPNIIFFPAVSPDAVLEYTASADVGIALIENTCLSYYYCMPNKLFEYAMAGVPTIASNMKEMATFIENNKVGVVIKELNVACMTEAINDISKLDLKELRANCDSASRNYAWNIQEAKMLAGYSNWGIKEKL